MSGRRQGQRSLEADRRLARRLAWALGVVGVVACVLALLYRAGRDAEGRAEPLPFEGVRALAVVEELVARGPRHPGAPGREAIAAHLLALLEPHVEQTALQRFEAADSVSGETFALSNVVGRLAPGEPRRLVVATQWDSSPRSSRDPDESLRDRPTPGANDGASGVGVAVELARVLGGRLPRGLGLDLVLLDGQEVGAEGAGDASQGARVFVRRLSALYPSRRPELVVVLDSVGACGGTIRPEISNLRAVPELVGRIWSIAGELGFGPHFGDAAPETLAGDHTAFLRSSLPAVLLMDYDYPFRRTTADTVDKLCAESLERVGTVLTTLILRDGSRDG